MSDKEPEDDKQDNPDLLDRSTTELGEYAESSTRERTPVVTKTARAEDGDESEVPERDDSEPPD